MNHVNEFRDSIEDHKAEYTGHDIVVNENAVTFEGDWHAAHEAWLFKQWLDDEGYMTTFGRTKHGYKDPKTVAIVEGVDVPDWVQVIPQGKDRIVLRALDVQVEAFQENAEDAVDELRKKTWKTLDQVSGVGRATIESIANEFDTPMDAVSSFEDVDGVGESTAETLNNFVSIHT